MCDKKSCPRVFYRDTTTGHVGGSALFPEAFINIRKTVDFELLAADVVQAVIILMALYTPLGEYGAE